MPREPFHPAPEQISLSDVYDALADPVRRLIVARLAGAGPLSCSSFLEYGSKTGISYHLARLREAGITTTRLEGKSRFMALRDADLERRFPGLLPAVIASVRAEAGLGGTKPAAKKAAGKAANVVAPKVPATKVPAAKAAARKKALAAA